MVNLNTPTKNLIFLVILSFLLTIASIGYWAEGLTLKALPWTLIVLLAISLIGARMHDHLIHQPHKDKHLYAITIYPPGDSCAETHVIGYDGVKAIQIRNKQVILSTDSSDIIYNGCPYSEVYNIIASNKRSAPDRHGSSFHYNKLEVELSYYLKAHGVSIEKTDSHRAFRITNLYLGGDDWLHATLRTFNKRHNSDFQADDMVIYEN